MSASSPPSSDFVSYAVPVTLPFESDDEEEFPFPPNEEEKMKETLREYKRINNDTQQTKKKKPPTTLPPIQGHGTHSTSSSSSSSSHTPSPSPVDFIRNYLSRLNFRRSLDVFQSEFHAATSSGLIENEEELRPMDSAVLATFDVDQTLKSLRSQLVHSDEMGDKIKNTWGQLRKERDFHRMHHRRVVQEKNGIMKDLRRLQGIVQELQPQIDLLQSKYEGVNKEKALAKIEINKLKTKIEKLEEEKRKYMEANNIPTMDRDGDNNATYMNNTQSSFTLHKTTAASNKSTMKTLPYSSSSPGSSSMSSTHPPGHFLNPQLPSMSTTNNWSLPDSKTLAALRSPVSSNPPTSLNPSTLSLKRSFNAHTGPVSSLCPHPLRSGIIATGGDDGQWKLWNCSPPPSSIDHPSDLLVSGKGHNGWISSLSFHYQGKLLLSSSSDSTIKIWDLITPSCITTLNDHNGSIVWDIQCHNVLDLAVSSSMDHTSRVYDLHVNKCKTTLRGHVDSVNTASFQPYGNVILSGSGDKTISLWDIRGGQGHAVKTLFGHTNAIIDAVWHPMVDYIWASIDTDGKLVCWDMRMGKEFKVMDCYSSGSGRGVDGKKTSGVVRGLINEVRWDESGEYIMGGGEEGIVKIWSLHGNTHTNKGLGEDNTQGDDSVVKELGLTGDGNGGGIQAVKGDISNRWMYSGYGDGSVKIWGSS